MPWITLGRSRCAMCRQRLMHRYDIFYIRWIRLPTPFAGLEDSVVHRSCLLKHPARLLITALWKRHCEKWLSSATILKADARRLLAYKAYQEVSGASCYYSYFPRLLLIDEWGADPLAFQRYLAQPLGSPSPDLEGCTLAAQRIPDSSSILLTATAYKTGSSRIRPADAEVYERFSPEEWADFCDVF